MSLVGASPGPASNSLSEGSFPLGVSLSTNNKEKDPRLGTQGQGFSVASTKRERQPRRWGSK